MSNGCKLSLRNCNGNSSLALASECNGFKCQYIKKRYNAALTACRNGDCSQLNEIIGNNNILKPYDLKSYAIGNSLSIDEKQLIAQVLRKTGNPKYALEVSRSISGSLNLSEVGHLDMLENSLRFQGAILKSMNKIDESNFIISTANHINELANKAR